MREEPVWLIFTINIITIFENIMILWDKCKLCKELCCAVLGCVQLFTIPWTVALQSPLSMGGLQARILNWIVMPFASRPSQPGIKPKSPALQVDSSPSESPRKPQNIGVGSLSLLQGNFLTQESNWGLLHCRQILYRLSHQGSPRIQAWVAYCFSRGTFWPRNQTGFSCIAGGFFTSWTTREVLKIR